MSNTVLIIGESGTGKSTSVRNLNPKETFYLNVLNKPLPFKHGKTSYVKGENWQDIGNYYASDDWIKILKCIEVVSDTRPDIKTLVIDDIQYILANEFMNRISERGYEKFSEIGRHFWDIINGAIGARDDLVCVLMSHSETDASGKAKCKTIGKMLDEKITIEGMFTIILHSIYTDAGYKFITQFDGHKIAKSPMGMFEDKQIDNDLVIVLDKINNYYN